MKNLILFKVTYRDSLLGDFFNKTTHYVAADDVNEVYHKFRSESKVKVKPWKVIEIINDKL